MAFKAEPEIINGRLCMLAFVAAVGAELATGEPVLQQFKDQPVLVVVAAALFAWASLVPVLLGKKSDSTTLGPFRPSAELLNGRAAPPGFISTCNGRRGKHNALSSVGSLSAGHLAIECDAVDEVLQEAEDSDRLWTSPKVCVKSAAQCVRSVRGFLSERRQQFSNESNIATRAFRKFFWVPRVSLKLGDDVLFKCHWHWTIL